MTSSDDAQPFSSTVIQRARRRTLLAVEMVAVCSMSWALIALGPSDSLFYKTLDSLGWVGPWFAIQAGLGLWLLIASRVRVSERQIEAALTCNAIALAVLFVPFLLKAIVTPVTVLMPYMAWTCIRLSLRDHSKW